MVASFMSVIREHSCSWREALSTSSEFSLAYTVSCWFLWQTKSTNIHTHILRQALRCNRASYYRRQVLTSAFVQLFQESYSVHPLEQLRCLFFFRPWAARKISMKGGSGHWTHLTIGKKAFYQCYSTQWSTRLDVLQSYFQFMVVIVKQRLLQVVPIFEKLTLVQHTPG